MRHSEPNMLSRAMLGLFALPLISAVVLANEANYSQTLASTAWIITSNAEEETSTGTGVFVDADKATGAHQRSRRGR